MRDRKQQSLISDIAKLAGVKLERVTFLKGRF